jgi:hypothetical protein
MISSTRQERRGHPHGKQHILTAMVRNAHTLFALLTR